MSHKPSALMKIKEFYRDKWGEVELTEAQEMKRQRLIFAFNILVKENLMKDAIPFIMKNYNLSESQAIRDINDAKELFGAVMKNKKDAHRAIVYEMAMETYKAAKLDGDYMAMSKTLSNVIKLLGLDRDDPDIPDFGKLQPNVYPIIIAPEIERKLDQLLDTKGPVNLSKMYKNAEEIEVDGK